jgi:DNA-binding CsgD family transcriptional regulator
MEKCTDCERTGECIDIHKKSGKLLCEVIKFEEGISNSETRKINFIKNYVNQDHVNFDPNWLLVENVVPLKKIDWGQGLKFYDFSFIKNLTERQCDCLVMRLNGMSYYKIAEQLGVEPEAIFLYTSNAFSKIRKESGLSEKHLKVLFMYLQGKKYKEIAGKIHVSVPRVAMILRWMEKNLKEFYILGINSDDL